MRKPVSVFLTTFLLSLVVSVFCYTIVSFKLGLLLFTLLSLYALLVVYPFILSLILTIKKTNDWFIFFCMMVFASIAVPYIGVGFVYPMMIIFNFCALLIGGLIGLIVRAIKH